MRRSWAAIGAVVFGCMGLASAALADETSGCEHSGWPMAREHGWFAAAAQPVTSGSALAGSGQGVAVTLLPSAQVSYGMPPQHTAKAGTFGAILTVTGLKPGLYQVTVSDEAWIDVVQDGKETRSASFVGLHGCPDLRKSVRFRLTAALATLQISGAPTNSIKVGFAPVE